MAAETVEDDSTILIKRPVYTQEDFNTVYPRTGEHRQSVGQRLRTTCTPKKAGKFVYSLVPIIETIRTYKWREYMLPDFLGGLSVGIMHIPQGMGFPLLANVQPVFGLYSSFFPVLFYLIFGSSPHVSIGTNAVICLLLGNIIKGVNSTEYAIGHLSQISLSDTNFTFGAEEIDNIAKDYNGSLAATVTFLVGIVFIGMSVFRLGFITSFMSDSFVSGFIFAAAIQIASSQVPKCIGVTASGPPGAGRMIKMYIDMFDNISQFNLAELIIAVSSGAAILLVKELINEHPKIKKYLIIPIPIDLLVMVIGTLISHFVDLHQRYDVLIVGKIPVGIPAPEAPPLEHISKFAGESVVLAVIIFTLTIALGKLMARKHQYELDSNQELAAYGVSNFVSSFFFCVPACIAPPRTVILSGMGARTTLNGVSTSVLLLRVLLVFGRLFESLPISVLAGMIIVAMKPLLWNAKDIPMLVRTNKYDLLIWFATALAGIFLDLDYGLFVGIGISLVLYVVQSRFQSGFTVGRTEEKNILSESNRRSGIENIPGIRIYKFNSALFYVTVDAFRSLLYESVFNPQDIARAKKKAEDKAQKLTKESGAIDGDINDIVTADTSKYIYDNAALASDKGKNPSEKFCIQDDLTTKDMNDKGNQQSTLVSVDAMVESVKVLILDCSSITYIDVTGIKALLQIVGEFRSVDVKVLFVGVHHRVWKSMDGFGFFDKVKKTDFYLANEDAIYCCEHDSHNPSTERNGDTKTKL